MNERNRIMNKLKQRRRSPKELLLLGKTVATQIFGNTYSAFVSENVPEGCDDEERDHIVRNCFLEAIRGALKDSLRNLFHLGIGMNVHGERVVVSAEEWSAQLEGEELVLRCPLRVTEGDAPKPTSQLIRPGVVRKG